MSALCHKQTFCAAAERAAGSHNGPFLSSDIVAGEAAVLPSAGDADRH
jgi:hypothetical protein